LTGWMRALKFGSRPMADAGASGSGNPPSARLAAHDVTFSYATKAGAFGVSGWSAVFDAGSITAMTGSSGCGKSTRLYLLGLMLRLKSGAVELDGVRVDRLSDASRSALRANRFGFVFQDAALDPTRTVMDNIVETALYRGQARAQVLPRASALMERFDIAVPAGRRPGQISGGQAQRIALCRALLSSPDVLLADEPTGNLDPVSAQVVLGALREHADAGGCVVLVTHDPAIATWADRRVDVERAA
jgi:lipoprotein-releasing system ATP-binding protein